MDYTTITFTADGPIGLLTLNRPAKLNALNQAMIEELDHLLGELAANRDIRVVILTGAGEKGFCSGLDMTETAAQLFEVTPDLIYFYQSRTSMLFYKMRRIPQPIIAAVHGAAAGAGFSFAMAADVRVVTPQARFNAAYINIGLGGADLCSSFFLPKLIGTGRAYEFLMTGDFMSAQEAKELGFVSRIVEREKLMETAYEIANKMVSKNPVGLWMTKEAINMNLDGASLEQALHLENRNQAFMITAMKVPKK
jgi:enoyl-CoA hydratase/carnithine racemase